MGERSLFLPKYRTPATPKLRPVKLFDWRGLDMYSPDEQADDRRSPYGKNFRLFAPNDSAKRISIAKRRGHAVYSTPVGETQDQAQTTTTGAADQSATLTAWLAQKFTAGATGPLTRVDVNLKNTAGGTGPVIVAIYGNTSGSPGTLLATSSILSSSITSSYQYLSAKFMEAPSVTATSVYWIVVYVQAYGTNNYKWSSTTAASTAKTSTDSGNTWSAAAFDLNFKTYVSTAGAVKGVYRRYSTTGSPQTLFAHVSDVYKVNDGTGAVTSIKGSLTSTASFYDWDTVNDKTYWANGIDAVQSYDGTTVAAVSGGIASTLSAIEIYKNRVFYLQKNTNYVIYSDAAAYETFGVTSFIYIPAPKTADPVLNMFAMQEGIVFITRNNKYILYGSDSSTFAVKESPTRKGAVSETAMCRDGEFIYFMANDGLIYRYDGTRDENLVTERVWPITKNMANTTNVYMYVQDRKLHVTYRETGQSVENNKLIFDLVYNEWLSDEDTYTNFGIVLGSQTDTNQLVVASSTSGTLWYGDTGTNDAGKPISFEYRTKYFSFGNPASKHRVKRYYPFLTPQSGSWKMDCQIDNDLLNAPTSNLVTLNYSTTSTSGALWGGGYTFGSLADGGSGLIYGSGSTTTTIVSLPRLSVPGANRRTQFRFVQSGVDQPVGVEGMELYILQRRPV